MEKLVGNKNRYKGKKIGHVTVITEGRTGHYLKKDGSVADTKSCLVQCECKNRYEVPLLLLSNGNTIECKACNRVTKTVVKKNLKTQSLFESLMKRWNPTTHKPDTYKLPYFKGTIGDEYIAGFCYVNKEKYDYLSKVMCIKIVRYVQFNRSKENCGRLGEVYKGCRTSKTSFIHSSVDTPLGLVHDHINGLSLDNRTSNIRVATSHQNSMNKRKTDKNTSGFVGVVYYVHKDKSWRAQIQLGSLQCTKCFYEKEDAITYRDLLALAAFKEFVKLNRPEKLEWYQDNLSLLLDEKHKIIFGIK